MKSDFKPHINAIKIRFAKAGYCTFILQMQTSDDVAKKNVILFIWCNAMCLCSLRLKKHIIFHILYIIVAPLCPAFLKRVDFYKAIHSEKQGVL